MAITKERLQELIEQEAVVYTLDGKSVKEIKLLKYDEGCWEYYTVINNDLSYFYEDHETGKYDLFDRIRCDCIYSTRAEAEDALWRKSLVVQRKPLDFRDVPSWEEAIAKNLGEEVYNKNTILIYSWKTDKHCVNVNGLDCHTEAEYKAAVSKAIEEIVRRENA